MKKTMPNLGTAVNVAVTDSKPHLSEAAAKLPRVDEALKSLESLDPILNALIHEVGIFTLCFIPGTRYFKSRMLEEMLSRSRKRKEQFRKIRSVDAKTKNTLFPLVRHNENLIAIVEVQVQTLMLYSMLLLGLMLTVQMNSWGFFDSSPSPFPIINRNFDYQLVFFGFCIVAIVLAVKLRHVKLVDFSFIALVFFFLGAVLTVIGPLVEVSMSHGIFALPPDVVDYYRYLAIRLFVILESVVFMPLVLILINSLEHRISRKYPSTIVMDRLLQILVNTETRSQDWASPDFKTELTHLVEEIAVCIQQDLPMSVQESDATTNLWYKKLGEQIANEFRNLKKWILAPRVDTYQNFTHRIAQDLVYAIQGSWDNFERSEPIRTSALQIIRNKFVTVVRVTIVGLLPGILLWFFQTTPLAFNSPFDEYAKISVFLWAIISVVAAADPLFGIKLNAFKDLYNLFVKK